MTCRITLICAAAPARLAFPAGDEPAAAKALARLSPSPSPSPLGGAATTSPMLRARQTAEALGLVDAAPEPALREVDFGLWAGQRIEAVLAAGPEGFALWRGDPGRAPPGGESFLAMSARVVAWLEARAASGGSLVAITHPGPMQAALLHVLGGSPGLARRIGVRPLSRLHLTHDGREWSVLLDG